MTRALRIALGLSVLAAVNLDDQLCGYACKVGEVWGHRMLATEAVARKGFPQCAPERALRFRGIRPKLARSNTSLQIEERHRLTAAP